MTLSELQALALAIATGVTKVHFQDRTVDYPKPADLLAAYAFAYNELYPTAGSNGQNGPIRQIRIRTSKGM
jgi:hypothetical protein